MEQKAIRHMYFYLLVLAVAVTGIMLTGNAHAADIATQPAPVTLQTSLASIISQVQGGIQAGVGFLQQELPDVIKQLLVWKAARAAFISFLCTVLFFTGLTYVYKSFGSWGEVDRLEAYAKVLKEGRDSKEAYALAHAQATAAIAPAILHTVLAVVFGIIGFVAFWFIWPNLLEVLQIYIAPKVWLIEYAASLVK